MYIENVLVTPNMVVRVKDIPKSSRVELILKNGTKIVAYKEQFENYEQFKAHCG